MFSITKQQAQQVLNYLISRPYAEVHSLVALLKSLVPVQIVEPKKDEPTPAPTGDQTA